MWYFDDDIANYPVFRGLGEALHGGAQNPNDNETFMQVIEDLKEKIKRMEYSPREQEDIKFNKSLSNPFDKAQAKRKKHMSVNISMNGNLGETSFSKPSNGKFFLPKVAK